MARALSANKLVSPNYDGNRKFGEYIGPEGPKDRIWNNSPCKFSK